MQGVRLKVFVGWLAGVLQEAFADIAAGFRKSLYAR
jgi:hypothetical protein